MNFDIEELKIQFYTNMRGKGNQIIEFKRSMLYHPELQAADDLNEYPYFTFDVPYPLNRLRYLTYNDRVEFFFNKQKFIERLDAYSDRRYILKKSNIPDEEEYYRRRDKNIENNIMTMIEILFPTKFPVINDLRTSYDHVFNESSIRRMILNPVIRKHFSYLKVNGQVYTFKKNIWLNDMLNHPMYRRLINEYRKFWVWANEEKSRWVSIVNKAYPTLRSPIDRIWIRLFQIIKDKILSSTTIDNGEVLLEEKMFAFITRYFELLLLNNYTIEEINKHRDEIILFIDDLEENSEETVRLLQDEIIKIVADKTRLEAELADNEEKKTQKKADFDRTEDERIRVDPNLKRKRFQDVDVGKKFNETRRSISDSIRELEVKKKKIDKEIARAEKKGDYNLLKGFLTEIIQATIENFKVPTDIIAKSKEVVRLLKLMKDEDSPLETRSLLIFENPLELPVEKYQKVLDLFEKPFSVIQKEQNPIPPEYRNFAYVILSEYRRPQRESTNVTLQNIINGFDANSVQDFFTIFEKIYDVYMIGQGNKFDAKEEKRYKDLLNVGMCYINTNVSKGVRREIYVMSDFIEGEVNKDNVNNIYCPFVSDHLGNEFEYLVRMFQYGKVGNKDTNRWAVDRNRMIFSLKQLESQKAEELGKNVVMVARAVGMPDNAARDLSQKLIVPEQQNRNLKNLERLNTLFLSRVVADDKGIKDAFTDVNQYDQTTQIYDLNLLEYLKKNKKELYDLIEEWNEKEQQRDNKVLDKLIKLKSVFKGEIEALEQQLKNYEINTDNVKKNKINYEIARQELYIAVADKLIKIEQGKVEKVVIGGNRSRNKKRLYRKHRVTKRHK
jgi:hypothetical protein